MKARKVFALSILTASMALAAGCSSDDDEEPAPAPVDPGTDPVVDPGTDPVIDPGTDPMTPDPVMDMSTNTGNSILDLARGTDGDDEDMEIDADDTDGGTPANPDLETLVAAAGGFPGIVNLLDDETAVLTVFAPTDDAFDALGADAPTGDALARVLQYHVINGTNLDATAIANSLTAGGDPVAFETAIGEDLMASLSMDGTTVTITDGMGNEVPVVTSIETPANGTVHVIGSVLLPPAAPEPTPTDPMDPTDMPGAGGDAVAGSSFAIIEGDDDLSEFEALVRSSGFKESLEDVGNRSQVVFAPRNGSLETGVDTVVAYVHTNRGETEVGPVAAGTYPGTGAMALSFEVAGDGETLTVNGLPAEYIETSSGAALYVYGGAADGS